MQNPRAEQAYVKSRRCQVSRQASKWLPMRLSSRIRWNNNDPRTPRFCAQQSLRRPRLGSGSFCWKNRLVQEATSRSEPGRR